MVSGQWSVVSGQCGARRSLWVTNPGCWFPLPCRLRLGRPANRRDPASNGSRAGRIVAGLRPSHRIRPKVSDFARNVRAVGLPQWWPNGWKWAVKPIVGDLRSGVAAGSETRAEPELDGVGDPRQTSAQSLSSLVIHRWWFAIDRSRHLARYREFPRRIPARPSTPSSLPHRARCPGRHFTPLGESIPRLSRPNACDLSLTPVICPCPLHRRANACAGPVRLARTAVRR